MSFRPINTRNSLGSNFSQINDMVSQINREQTTKTFKQANGNALIQGKLPHDLGYGTLLYGPDDKVSIASYINSAGLPILKVALSGYDALTATDTQLAFNSAKSFTVALKGSYTFPAHSVGGGGIYYPLTQIIPHNATYIPAVSCFAPASMGGSAPPPVPPDFPSSALTPITQGAIIYQGTLGYMQVFYGVDETNFYLGMAYINDTGAPIVFQGVPVTYYVYTYGAI